MQQVLFSILSSYPAIVITVAGVLAISLSVFLIRVTIHRVGRSKFQRLAEELAGQVCLAQEEFEAIFVPTHLVEDREIDSFRIRHQSLLETIETLERHKYYNKDIFEKTGIELFVSLLADCKVKTEENRKVYNAITDLKDCAAKVMEDYSVLIHPTHYFTHSELD